MGFILRRFEEEDRKWLVSRRAPESGVWQGCQPFFHAHLVLPEKIKGFGGKALSKGRFCLYYMEYLFKEIFNPRI